MITTSNPDETYAVEGMLGFFGLPINKTELQNGVQFELDQDSLNWMRREIDGENE